MKAIMISCHAKWCALMMNGKKTIEVRKNKALAKAIQKLIDEYGYADIYVYCSKGKPNLWLPYEYDCFELDEASQPYLSDEPILDVDTKMNGKVIFKFRCYKVEEIGMWNYSEYGTQTLFETHLCMKSCLEPLELNEYLKEKPGYAIHISDLEVFDEPKELSEFQGTCNRCEAFRLKVCKRNPKKCDKHLTKAPQNYMFIEVD